MTTFSFLRSIYRFKVFHFYRGVKMKFVKINLLIKLFNNFYSLNIYFLSIIFFNNFSTNFRRLFFIFLCNSISYFLWFQSVVFEKKQN